MADSGATTLEVGGREVAITHPDKAVFPPIGDRPAITKMDFATPQAPRRPKR